MRGIVKLIMHLLVILLLSSAAFGATILSPIENQQVEAGSWITVVVKPAPGEQWQGFNIGFKPFEYDPLNKIYKLDIQVPNDILGYRNDLEVYGIDNSGNEFELKRRVFVKLPQSVVLQGIAAGHAGDAFVSLRKMPPQSNPVDVERYETRQLSVYGKYSDNVNRSLTSSTSGTTYISSNEQVVTVSPEGKLKAQGIGKAKITVKNGQFSASVDIVVKPYKQ